MLKQSNNKVVLSENCRLNQHYAMGPSANHNTVGHFLSADRYTFSL